MLKLSHLRLLVDDVATAYAFYKDILCLEPVFPGEGSVYCEFRTGDVTLSLFQKSLMSTVVDTMSLPSVSPQQDAAVLAFAVDDVDASYKWLSAKGVQFVREPHDELAWHMRVAQFRDPAGNLLEIGAGIEVKAANKSE